MNHLYIWLLCLIVGNKPFIMNPIMNHQVTMKSNTSAFLKLQPLILWTVHSEPPDDPNLSCYIQDNNTWFCTDNYILHSLVDKNDSY